jgi:TPR repeat protein
MKRALPALATIVLLAGSASAGTNEGIDAWKRRDYAAALREFRPAAERGHARAQYYLGLMYLQGRGVSRDEAEAEKWFRMAAEQGDRSALASLAMMARSQEGSKSARDDKAARIDKATPSEEATRSDTEAAEPPERLAAERGDAQAQIKLAAMYEEGRGVAKDLAEAARWYRLAAEQGHAKAQNILGVLYAEGQGVARDHIEAYKWFYLASVKISASERETADKAAHNRDHVASKMTLEDIERAKYLAAEFAMHLSRRPQQPQR